MRDKDERKEIFCGDSENTFLISSSDTSNTHGLSWQLAALFVIGEVLGGGIVAIGDSVVNIGWFGIVLITASFIANLYMVKILTDVTETVERVDSLRNPYSKAVENVLGKRAKLVSVFILHSLTLFVTTLYLLLSTEFLLIFIGEFEPNLISPYQFRLSLCIIAAILIPITWFGTPSDFWGVALFAALTSVSAAVLFSVNLWINSPSDFKTVPSRQITLASFFFGSGTIFFGCCALPYFPNIQSDMKDRKQFLKSASIGYMIITLIYIPIGVFAIVLLGDNVKPNIIFNAIDAKFYNKLYNRSTLKNLAYASLVSLAVHFIFAYNLIFNNIAQELEEWLKIKRSFGWKRCLLRTLIVLLTLTLAQLIPKLDIIISLTGGMLMVPLSYHLPALMHWTLHKESITVFEMIVLIVIVSAVTLLSIGSIYANLTKILELY